MSDRRSDQEGRQESRRILERVEHDSQPLLMRGASKARDHLAAREAAGEDWTELWGRRIGRTLGLVFAAILIIYLVIQLTGGEP